MDFKDLNATLETFLPHCDLLLSSRPLEKMHSWSSFAIIVSVYSQIFFPSFFFQNAKITTKVCKQVKGRFSKFQKSIIIKKISKYVLSYSKGSFTNYVYKTRQVGGLKMSTFCQRSYHRKCQHRGVLQGPEQKSVPNKHT